MLTGKIDYFVASYTTAVEVIASESFINIVPLDELESVKREDLRFGINKDKPLLHSIIQKSLNSIDDNFFLKLTSKWLLKNRDTISYDIEFTQEEKEFLQNIPVVKIGSINSYTPFSFLENNEKIGFTQDLISIISEKTGIRFKKTGGDWPDVYGKFKNGKIDIISELSFRQERLGFTIYTKPYYEIPIGVFTRDDFGSYKGLESLKGKKVGIVKNSYLINVLNNIKDIEVVELGSTDERFYALRDKEVDVVLSNAMSIFRLEELMLKDIRLTGYFIHPDAKKEDLRFGINKQNPVLASIINKTLESIPYSKITKLKQKWILGHSSNDSKTDKISLTAKEKDYLDKKRSITMCIDPKWMPFEEFDEKGKYTGMSSDYYKLFEKMLSTKFELINSSTWSESIEFAKQRKCDIMSLVMETPSRREYLNFTTPYLKVPLVIASNLDVQFVNDIQDLNNKKVGISKGYAFVEILRDKYPYLNIIEVENIDDGLDRVKSGELYAYIGTLATVGHKFQTKYSGELKIAGKIDDNWELGVGVRNDDQILFNIMQKAVDNISDDQRRDILNKWISIKYEKGVDYTLLWQVIAAFSIVLGIILYFLSKQIKLKEDLGKQKEEFESIFNYSKDGIAILDLQSNFLDFNDAYLKMTGFTKDELLSKSSIGLTAPKDIEKSIQAFKDFPKKSSIENFETIYIVKEGKRIFTNMSASLMPDKKRILLVTKDVSSLKLLEEQAKNASMGEMIGNIAHQWRQPLSAISSAASGMQVQKEYGILTDEIFNNTCETINNNAQYLSKTIDDFRDFIKGDRKKVKFNLKDNIESFLHLVEGSIKSNDIHILKNIEDITINSYPNELIQCFINIFNNAKDVLKEIEDEERYFFIDIHTEENNVIITLKDNAGGIPKDILPCIFEPYFTTKHKSQGTGLGLSMTYNLIAEGMDGAIEANNVEYEYKGKSYHGVEFKIALPLS
ncbi:MAG: transporter substrate-binding domain-containing protein [Campylobacterota bacterium]|nr:transporter substrate-binding domain-containing protein [Campylobacterota bacterium]